MTPEEANLGNRSHKEWLEGHNPAIVEEIYAPDCVIYANHIPRARSSVTRASRLTARSCMAPSPT